MAAFADGAKDERERAEIKRIAESLSAATTRQPRRPLPGRAAQARHRCSRPPPRLAAAGTAAVRLRDGGVRVRRRRRAQRGARRRSWSELRAALGLDAAAARRHSSAAGRWPPRRGSAGPAGGRRRRYASDHDARPRWTR
ncbi:MAG: hypothetical protein MZV65_47875 [Chromatiales bacterium]|nr:hypothetical protein [Chromatiales bacterium]